MDLVTIARWSRVCVACAALCLPLVGYWAAQTKFGTVMVRAWLPGEDLARSTYDRFLQDFGDDQTVFLTWPGCTLADPRLPQLSAAVSQLQLQQPELGILSIQDSASILRSLTEGRHALSLEEAQDRLAGIVLGDDGICFLTLHLAETDNQRLEQLFAELHSLAWQVAAIESDELIVAGEPFQVHIIDRASRETMTYYVAPSCLLALLLARLCLGAWRATFVVFLLAGVGQIIGLALIAFSLGTMSDVMVVLPTLIFMLTLSGAIHLANYYRDSGGLANPWAGASALRLGLRPCALATLTTVFGFGSLVMSQLKPVWNFGLLASVGLLSSTGLLLGVFPALIGWKFARQPRATADSPSERRRQVLPESLAAAGARFTATYANPITALGLLALLVSAIGVLRLKTSTEFVDMFPPDSVAVKSLQWVEQHLGPLSTLEFVISFQKPAVGSEDLPTFEQQILERLQLVRHAQSALLAAPETTSAWSAVSLLPAIPESQGTRSTIHRAVLRRSILAHLEELQAQHMLAESPETQDWRISVRTLPVTNSKALHLQAKLLAVVNGSLKDSSSPAAWPRQALVTGYRVVIERAHYALLSDLGWSFLTAFLLIVPVMMLIVRSIAGGLLLMIPNVLPVAIVFGAMGWLQIKLDVASILTASVALGIAVDDTLHFVSWYTRQRSAGQSPLAAVESSFACCARPMLHTTLICTGSMLPFLLSDFLPTGKFALLMILILAGAILGDLLLLPAILQSRWGGWIGHPPIKLLQPQRTEKPQVMVGQE